ncbi:MAG: YhdH/YhfP family quinone oxidoreductase [Anaerolineaceae bacterium]|jgi:putative YhdH/YhfP family quinone oxidoreductase|nr:YhdH/YhfP family quinone oxidoreductase [Anaerolineaceae bacterium]
MNKEKFRALVVEEINGEFVREVKQLTKSELPDGELLIAVKYSSLNYKDTLSATGNKGVTRVFPHIPGIDAAGVVVESKVSQLKTGQEVIVTGYDLGMNTFGGFSEYVSVPAIWCTELPLGMTLKESMMYGTAGLTAALSIDKLINHGIKPDFGSILVTGATGGVGSLSVAILSKLGYRVSASTGKDQENFLRELGAEQILSREEVNDLSKKALLKEQWAGVVDTVGGPTLATALKTTKYGMAVTCCGQVSSQELLTTVFPFILRGITLYGIDSVYSPDLLRKKVWNNLASSWKPECLSSMVNLCNLDDLSTYIDKMISGNIVGRIVVEL